MSQQEMLLKLATASPAKLRQVCAILNDTPPAVTRAAAPRDADIRLITYTDAAKRLNLSRPTVYRLAKLGRLEVVPLNGVNRIRLSSVFAFASGGAEGGAAI